MAKKTLTGYFAFERATKGTFVFKEVDAAGGEIPDPISGTFYIKKAKLPAVEPDAKLKMTIEIS